MKFISENIRELYEEKKLIDNEEKFREKWNSLKEKNKSAVIFVHDPMSAQSCSMELVFDMEAQKKGYLDDLKFLKLDYSDGSLRRYLRGDPYKVTMAPTCLLVKQGGEIIGRVEGERPLELKRKISRLVKMDITTGFAFFGSNSNNNKDENRENRLIKYHLTNDSESSVPMNGKIHVPMGGKIRWTPNIPWFRTDKY